MTREEAIEMLNYIKRIGNGESSYKNCAQSIALDMAISALSENKGDLISRQAVINAIANTCFWLSADNWEELTKCINSIPSVENKGEWIEHEYAEEFCGRVVSNFECPFCHDWYLNKTNFCPNCGSDMRGVSE